MIGDGPLFPDNGVAEREAEAPRRHERSGRLLGEAIFVGEIETRLGRRVRPSRSSRPKAARPDSAEAN